MIREIVMDIVRRHAESKPEELADRLVRFIATRETIIRSEVAASAARFRHDAIREAIRQFCDHPKTEWKASHYNPAPADTWDECVVCGEKLNFRHADNG